MEGFNKKEKGLMDMDNCVVIEVGGDIRGLNGNGKKYKFFKKRIKIKKYLWLNLSI